MKRRVIYLIMGLAIIGIIAGNRLRQKSLWESNGYLGDEVVFFSESTSSETENENNTIQEENSAGESGAQKKAGKEADTTGDNQAKEEKTQVPPTPEPTKEAYEKITSKGKVQIYDTATVLVDDTAYELYNYVNSAASRYAKAVNKLTKKLDSRVTVYDLIAPTSVGITFPDNRKKKINSSDQQEAINNIENKLSGREKFVPLYDIMMRHRSEYIFFKTDHHWTSLGAYYAYRAFCDAKGIVPNELSSYKKKSFSGFLGTFYRDTNQNKNLKADTLEVLYPLSENLTLEYTSVEGKKVSAPVIADAGNYGASLKYCVYIAGDNPYTVIRNKDKKDGTSCIVVKESYGNAFVPFLADHYQTVYVVDYRYWEGNLYHFIKKKKLREVILINNISMTRNSYLIGKLTQIIA